MSKGAQRAQRNTKYTTNLKKSMMNEEEVIKTILDEAFYIHKSIGPGMLEGVYQTVLLTGFGREVYL
jgi:hypothetical protein